MIPSEAVVILLDGTKGVEVGTERVWQEARKRNLPVILFVNKMDKENVKFQEVIDEIHSDLSKNAVLFALEIGGMNNYKGYATVLDKEAHYVDGKVEAAPADLSDAIDGIFAELTEQAAEANE